MFDSVALSDAATKDRVLHSAVDSFGRLVKLGGAMTASETSRHIEDMLQLLNGSDAFSSAVALRLLAEIAKNAPARFNLYADKFVANFYHFLFHEDASLQQDAISALKVNAIMYSYLVWMCGSWQECLGVVAQRASGKRQGWFHDLAQNLMTVVMENTKPKMLRALVALRCVIQHSSGNLLAIFPALSDMVTSLMSYPDPSIQAEVILTIPVLAQICPQNFAQSIWTASMDYYLSYLHNKTCECL